MAAHRARYGFRYGSSRRMSDDALIRRGGGAMAGTERSPDSSARIDSPINSCLSHTYDIDAVDAVDVRPPKTPGFKVPTADNRITITSGRDRVVPELRFVQLGVTPSAG